jgi:hypothetical protein
LKFQKGLGFRNPRAIGGFIDAISNLFLSNGIKCILTISNADKVMLAEAQRLQERENESCPIKVRYVCFNGYEHIKTKLAPEKPWRQLRVDNCAGLVAESKAGHGRDM